MPNVCRCCFAYEDGPPVFKEIQRESIAENSSLQIAEFLVQFTGIALDSHLGAMHICPVCETKLRDAFEFRELVIATNVKCELAGDEDELIAIKDEPNNPNDTRFSEVFLSEEQMLIEPVEEEQPNSQLRKKRKPNQSDPEPVTEELEHEKSEELPEPDGGLNEDAMDIESTYMCPVCDEIVKTYRLLKTHRNTEHAKGVHNRPCPVCQQPTEKGYLKHIVEVHKDYKPHTCAFCSRGFQHAFKLNNHLFTHIEGKKFKCLGCGEAYRSVKQLRGHIYTYKHSSRYSCPLCGLGFEQIRSIVGHFNETHEEVKLKIFPCGSCNRIYLVRKYFEEHVCSEKAKLSQAECVACDLCPDLEIHDEEQLLCHNIAMHENPQEKFTCKQCSQDFPLKQLLDRHCASAHQDNLVQCDDCGKCFPSRQRLRVHKIVHSDVRDIKCPQCPSQFKDRRYLKQHIALIHSGQKNFKCDICERMFGTMGHLKCHMGTHFENLRRFECELCQKKFVRVVDRDRHIQRTHRDERPHKCGLCPKAYYAGNHLREHQRSAHSDVRFECKHCGNRYARSKSLVEHIFSHLGYKPFNCPAAECAQGFVKKESFKKHLVKSHSIQFDEAVHGFKTSFQEILKAGLKEV